MTDTPASPTGMLLVDKPLGVTSMGVCRVVRRRLVNGGAPKRVKVGHGGTLDPLATGLLVVLCGRRATRLCGQVMDGAKRYTTEIDLAHFSTTDDSEGELTPVPVKGPPSPDAVAAACASFVGVIQQTPPAYSAMKVDGKRAYALARAGTPPTLEPRPVRIDAIELLDYDYPRLTIDVRCGKGTYIRSLARDLGGVLATGGRLTGLRRTEVAPFDIANAITLDDVPDPLTEADLMPIDDERDSLAD